MRPSNSLLALAFIANASAQDPAYTAICPAMADGQPHEIKPGYKVEYKCDTLGPNNGSPTAASSAVQCAESCEQTPGCTGSSWVSSLHLCYLSGSNPERSYQNAVYMKRVEDELSTCQRDLLKTQQDLLTCQNWNGTSPGNPVDPVNYCKLPPLAILALPLVTYDFMHSY